MALLTLNATTYKPKGCRGSAFMPKVIPFMPKVSPFMPEVNPFIYEPETILASTMFIGRVSWTSVFGNFPGKTIGDTLKTIPPSYIRS